jgi:hypothetical protein
VIFRYANVVYIFAKNVTCSQHDIAGVKHNMILHKVNKKLC